MDANQLNWSVGEIVSLTRKTTQVHKSGLKSYEHLINSRYICIRECDDTNRGILVKVLGKMNRENIIMSGGEPFCKDDKDEGFTGDTYYGYRFPKVDELKEVLDIIRGDQNLIAKFEKASMHINPNSTFWVRDTTSRFIVLKAPQYYDTQSNELNASRSNDKLNYRITLAYFDKSQISW